MAYPLDEPIAKLCEPVPGSWSVVIRPVEEAAAPLAAHRPDLMLATASSAKVLLLLALAEEITAGRLDPDRRLDRGRVEAVHDSGLWQHLNQPTLPITDVATLVGAVSDNWATNVLIDLLGLDRTTHTAARHHLTGVQLHDQVRDVRGPDDPPTLSTGHAAGYADLMARLWREREDPAMAMTLAWLRPGVDHSMVAGAFGLDPLAHMEPDNGVIIVNKTGTDAGVRADSGVIHTGAETVAYSCLVNWDESARGSRHTVMDTMRRIGEAIATHLRMPY